MVPSIMRTSLRLTGVLEASASSTYVEGAWTANDLYDPQGGLGAAQCPGYDQLALLYDRYRVISSEVKVRASLNSTSVTPTATSMEFQVVLFPSFNASAAASITDAMSQPLVKHKMGSGEVPVSLSSRINIAQYLGNTVNADRMQALISSGPAQVLYWKVGIVSRAYTTVSTTIQVDVTFDCEFFQRNQLDKSTQDLVAKAYLQRCRYLHMEEVYRIARERKGPAIDWVPPGQRVACISDEKGPPNSPVEAKQQLGYGRTEWDLVPDAEPEAHARPSAIKTSTSPVITLKKDGVRFDVATGKR